MITLLTATAALVAMEPYSALVHRILWHGPLRSLHGSHHAISVRPGLQANDLLSLFHAPLSLVLVVAGLVIDGGAGDAMLGAGLGLSLYGALYFVFHDGMVHGRLPLAHLLKRFALCRAWQAAHAVHHKTARGPYGFFASPLVLHLAERHARLRAQHAATTSR